jgi:GNAT superfamily N-acetyltransferase
VRVSREVSPTLLAPVHVRPVNTASDRRRFIAFPYTLYRESPYWVAPLRRDQWQLLFSKNNPFFLHSRIVPFIAEDSRGRVLGRIAAIINGMHQKRHNDGVGFFGFFECVERDDVAAALFDAVAATLREQACAAMRGPTNPSINESSGVLVDGFDRAPSLIMPYNPPYYERFLLQYGFERRMRMWAYYGAWKHLNTSRLKRGAELVRRRIPGLSLRNPDMSRFAEEALTMCEIYNRAFNDGWGNVPLTEAEFMYAAKAMRPILDPNLIFFLEHRGCPVGFSLSLPNINIALSHLPDGRLFPTGFLKLLGYLRFGKPLEFRTVVLALLPEYQRRGLDSLLILSTIEKGREHGYVASELGWVMDNNVVLRNALDNLGAVVDKEYALFEKRL